jgi:hypothetical protein
MHCQQYALLRKYLLCLQVHSIRFNFFVLQIFLTYTPYVNTFFSNEGIDGVAWGRIIGFMIAIFLVVEAEKVYGMRYFMPYIRSMGMCRPTDQSHEIAMTDEELNSVLFLATSASTMGMPVSHH